MHLAELPTPSLLVDPDRVARNCAAMLARARRLGVTLRPHLKTAKSVDVARLATHGQPGGITVSTLAEIDWFGERGFTDITYAVGIAAHKIEALAQLQRRHGLALTLVADHAATVTDVAQRAAQLDARFALLIEIDCGGGRGGVAPDGVDLLALAQAAQASTHLRLAGVLTHAGQSYAAPGHDAIAAVAEAERAAAVHAAARLRAAGLAAPVVSVGSTPTAMHARSLEGVTEMRPGVYTLFDLDQVALGVCTLDDIAACVLASVIGHNPRSRRVLIDAGGLALSKDLSANGFAGGVAGFGDVGYGLVCAIDGTGPLPGLRVAEVHQEHGFIASANAGDADTRALFARLPIGSRVRILPNHVCMTAAPYDHYEVVRAGNTETSARWPKAGGWNPTPGGRHG